MLLISDSSQVGVKRFITLIITLHFLFGSFLFLGLFWFLIFHQPKGNIDFIKLLIDTLKVIFEYDFYIILAGFGFISITSFGNMMVEKAKALASTAPSTISNIETVQGDVKTSTDNIKPDQIEQS